jgi:hypothetical protein
MANWVKKAQSGVVAHRQVIIQALVAMPHPGKNRNAASSLTCGSCTPCPAAYPFPAPPPLIRAPPTRNLFSSMPPSSDNYIDLTGDDDDNDAVATGAKRSGVQDETLSPQTAKKPRTQPLESGSDSLQSVASDSNGLQPVASGSNISASASLSGLASSSETASDGDDRDDQSLTLSEVREALGLVKFYVNSVFQKHERLLNYLEASIALARGIAEETHVSEGIVGQVSSYRLIESFRASDHHLTCRHPLKVFSRPFHAKFATKPCGRRLRTSKRFILFSTTEIWAGSTAAIASALAV